MAPERAPQVPDSPLIGTGPLMRMVHDNQDTAPVWNALVARTQANPADAPAWMDLAVLMQASGQRDTALQVQKAAITLQPVYRRRFGDGSGPRVLVFVTPGDMMANTPVDFLLEGSHATLFYVYIDARTDALPDLPAADAAFLAIGPSDETRAALENAARLLAGWRGPPVMNGVPERIVALTREGVAARLAGTASIMAPPARRLARSDLAALAAGARSLIDVLEAGTFPLVVRPAESHAGKGMSRIDDHTGFAAYLRTQTADAFVLSPFVDYAGPDGLYRKQRIVFIDGRPFASHMATSEHWIVHYLSAGMADRAERRAAERDWMETFDTDFAERHADAFSALCTTTGLDYFGIDCAEMPDGRLLVFEADTAMIVHDMDSPETFPYKKPVMRKLFAAFQSALAGRGATI